MYSERFSRGRLLKRVLSCLALSESSFVTGGFLFFSATFSSLGASLVLSAWTHKLVMILSNDVLMSVLYFMILYVNLCIYCLRFL